jgi:hypothetical protein
MCLYVFTFGQGELCARTGQLDHSPWSRKEKVDSEMQHVFSNSFLILKDVVKEMLMSS